MSKAEKTRELIIRKAAPIFNMKGYSGTSMLDLTEATGLTKGSIYGNFENKDEVAVAVYNYSVFQLNQRISDFLADKTKPLDLLIGIAEYYRENWKKIVERGGCPVQNASVEADDNHPVLKKHVQQSIKRWVRNISRIIEEGQRTGEIKSHLVAEEYAYTIISLLEGGILLSKIMNNQNVFYSAVDRIVNIIDQEMKITTS